jgi:hypothetical protein
MATATGKLSRVRAGMYTYAVGGRTYVLEEVKRCEGFGSRAQWNVSEQTGPTPYDTDPAFDAGNTLAEAKHWAECAARATEQEGRS